MIHETYHSTLRERPSMMMGRHRNFSHRNESEQTKKKLIYSMRTPNSIGERNEKFFIILTSSKRRTKKKGKANCGEPASKRRNDNNFDNFVLSVAERGLIRKFSARKFCVGDFLSLFCVRFHH